MFTQMSESKLSNLTQIVSTRRLSAPWQSSPTELVKSSWVESNLVQSSVAELVKSNWFEPSLVESSLAELVKSSWWEPNLVESSLAESLSESSLNSESWRCHTKRVFFNDFVALVRRMRSCWSNGWCWHINRTEKKTSLRVLWAHPINMRRPQFGMFGNSISV
jgi:hypothetical protein